MSWLLALPIVVPFLTAVLAFLTRQSPLGRWISVAGSAVLLFASANLALRWGAALIGVVSTELTVEYWPARRASLVPQDETAATIRAAKVISRRVMGFLWLPDGLGPVAMGV